MQTTLMGWIHQLGTLEYWEALLAGFEGLGPLVPILLAMVESFFPPLPLIAIVALNVAAHGGLLGFLYSWAGVALGGTIMFMFWRRLIKRFFWKVASRSPKLEKAQQWVNRFDTSSLFMLSLLPFTPTSFKIRWREYRSICSLVNAMPASHQVKNLSGSAAGIPVTGRLSHRQRSWRCAPFRLDPRRLK